MDDAWNARYNMVFSSDFLYLLLVVKQEAGVRWFAINTSFQFYTAFLEHFKTDKWQLVIRW